jgi:hypothetical protein
MIFRGVFESRLAFVLFFFSGWLPSLASFFFFFFFLSGDVFWRRFFMDRRACGSE